MKGCRGVAVVLLVGGLSSAAQPQETLFDVVSRSKRCHVQEVTGSIQCNYKIGKDLQISIPGVGEADVGVNFERSNHNGDFYASVGMQHGCVVVKPGEKSAFVLQYAFISPVNGKVYRTWEECQRRR